jgi:hypothetical protein
VGLGGGKTYIIFVGSSGSDFVLLT